MLTTTAAAIALSLATGPVREAAHPIKPPVWQQRQDGAAPVEPRVLAPRDHPSLGWKHLKVDFKGTLQEDVRAASGSDSTEPLETFHLKRGRVGVNGTLFGRVEFEIERELTTERRTAAELLAGAAQRTPWKDAFLDLEFTNSLQVRGGRFKIPFGLDALTPAAQGDFVYRTQTADYLAPSRDTGVMVHGRFFKRGLTYYAGAFAHDGDNARSKHTLGADRTYAARVAVRPLRAVSRALFADLVLGGAFMSSDVANDGFNPNGLRFETTLTDHTYFSPVYVNGQRRRWGADLEWLMGPASARAEYTEVRDERQGQGLGDVNLPDARYRSWYVAGTWLVTGEQKQRPLRPAAELFGGGVGAFELAGRYERIWADSVGGNDTPFRNPRAETILQNGSRVATVGLNWYVHQTVVLQFNLVRQQIEDPARNPVAGGGALWSRVLRLQLAL